MMRTFKSGVTIGMAMVALAMTAGCGDNDNSDGGGNANPQRTPTPVVTGQRTSTPTTTATTQVVTTATPTPGDVGSSTTVHFNFAVTAPLEGIQVDLPYPLAKGKYDERCTGGSNNGALCSNPLDPTECPGEQSPGRLATCDTTCSVTAQADPSLTIQLPSNDKDNGTLTLIAVALDNKLQPVPLPFPITVQCTFNQAAGQTLAPSDVSPPTQIEVTVPGGGKGDTTLLTVTPAVP